ncbi:MAG: cytochrome c [Bacteroidales bacterium]|nr:cytochrome c [Bacteroidales bacterium]MCF8339127.1 cytochrome c [Bacteroidales bacterium]
MKAGSFITIILFIVTLSSCYYDNEEDLYPQQAECDTTNVNYNDQIAPIMQNNCNSCHSGVSPNAGVITDNYEDLKAVAENGQLWGAVNHEPGYTPMPRNQPKLPECDLKKIRIWIDNGTPRN